jgi:multiple sugar transport system substrate-binding protein
MRGHAVILVLTVILTPLGAKAADLVVWWEKGYYDQENEAVREIIEVFEQDTGKQVELVQPTQGEFFDKAQAAVAAGEPPDFAFGSYPGHRIYQWALDDRLADLDEPLGFLVKLFDSEAIEVSTLLNGKTGERGLYALPMGRVSNHLHVWNSLLERAGFTLEDIPKEWDGFWSFWCDEVQPAVRATLGRNDIWAVGLPMSAAAIDTSD